MLPSARGACRLPLPRSPRTLNPGGAPAHPSVSFELRSKQQYLRSQGLKLRVRVPFTDWLAARLAPRADGPVVAAAAAARGGPWPATIAAAAAPLLLWQVAQLLTSWRQPSCWPAIDGA